MFKQQKQAKNLKELTGFSGGVIELLDECYFVDWSETEGNPEMVTFGGKIFGDGKKINAIQIATPTSHIKYIQDHEEKNGLRKSTIGFKSWKLDSETIVTINEYWT